MNSTSYASTIFASFADPSEAEKAAGALLDHGLRPAEISLLTQQPRISDPNAPHVVASEQEFIQSQNEIVANEATGSSYGHAVVNDMGRSMTMPETWPTPGSNMAYGAEMAGGIESTDAVTHYARGDEAFETDDGSPTYSSESQARGIPSNAPAPVAPTIRQPLSAPTGLTTTTAADVGAGAGKGAAVGFSVGILAALAALAIPGVGVILGGGALATAIAGVIGATGAGIVAGGVVGLLKDQGVPDEAVTVYREAFDRGGAILAVAIASDVDRASVEAVLAKYGAQNVEMYGQYRAA